MTHSAYYGELFCEDSVWIYSKSTMEILEQCVKSVKGNNKNAAAL